jgi:ADP-heptose:LPS heptosyltransferase
MTHRVLVVRLDSVGDVLLAGPAVRAIAAGRGGEPAEVWILCGPHGTPAARLLPGVTRVLTWDCPWITNSGRPSVQAVEQLREVLAAGCPAEAVILTSFHQSPLPVALLLRLAGVERITGASVDFAGTLLDVRLRPGEDFAEDQPESIRALTIAEAAGFRLPIGDSSRLAVCPGPDLTELTGSGPYVVVHPGASAPARAWPAENAAAAVRGLASAGFRVLVTGGPAEAELTARVAGTWAEDLGGQTDLAELSSVLAGADAAVIVNTGPAHLAAAVGTPVVSLFAPVVPAVRWAPYGVPAVLLGDQSAGCRGSRARECPLPGHPCLSSVTPAEVLEACVRLVGLKPATDVTVDGRGWSGSSGAA